MSAKDDLYGRPGLRFVGEMSHPQVNRGRPIPVFEPVAPHDRPSINTLEGWNSLAERPENLYSRAAAVQYLEAHGREATEEAIAEYRDWWDGWLDTFVDYDMPDVEFIPAQPR